MNEERIQKLLRSALPPLGETQPRRDLWPRMRQRIESAEAPRIRLGVWDWALAALLAAAILFFPGPIAGLFCQL
jgi:hypothetical protein